jgi:exonuclease VII large subunit
MSREELAEAASKLEEAAEAAAEDAAETLRTHAEQLRALVERDQGPDHGRLARHQAALNDVKADAEEAIADLVEEANERINEYRSRLEGV